MRCSVSEDKNLEQANRLDVLFFLFIYLWLKFLLNIYSIILVWIWFCCLSPFSTFFFCLPNSFFSPLSFYGLPRRDAQVLQFSLIRGGFCCCLIKNRPYNLIVVPPSKVNPEHYIFSPFGILHVHPVEGSETMTLGTWHRNSTVWHELQRIPFFKNCLLRKALTW